MALAEIAILETKVLHRLFRWWFVVIFAAWAFLVRVQEPVPLRRQGLGFYWPGIEAGLVVLLAVMTWVWCLARNDDRWWCPASPSRTAVVSVKCFVIYVYAIYAAVICFLVAIAVDAAFGTFPPGLALGTPLRVALLLLPVCALAPGLATFSRSIPRTTILWIAAWILSFEFCAPFPTFLLLRTEQIAMVGDVPVSLFAALTACAGAVLGCWAFALGMAKLKS